jgi:hypothetical protein
MGVLCLVTWCARTTSRIFLLGILIFKGLIARRLYKLFGVKGLIIRKWRVKYWLKGRLTRNREIVIYLGYVAKTRGGLLSVCLHAEVNVCFMWTSWHVWVFRWRLSDQRAPGSEILDGSRGEGIRGAREGSLWLQQLAAGAKKPNRRLISRVTQLWEPSRRICRRAIWSIDGNKPADIAARPVVSLQLCSLAKTTDVLLNTSFHTGER